MCVRKGLLSGITTYGRESDNCIMRNPVFYILHQILLKFKIKEACSTCEKCRNDTKFWSENMKGREYMDNLFVNGKVTLKWTLQVKGMMM